MATEKVRFRVRRGTQAEWDSVNPILADGEIGFAKDTGELRIGDGVTRWADRPRYAYFDEIDAALAAALEAKEAAELAAASAQSVVTQDLSAIAETLAVDATDVFIYDTTKDSDGGAWRNRCQHTSWYNEPLNTATRGARREFPAVAVIVADSTRVLIYDGDDTSLPFWGRIVPGTSTVSAVSARNGVIVIGAGSVGVMALGFVDESLTRWINTGRQSQPFSLDFVGSDFVTVDPNSGMVSTATSDVAIRVTPGAPVNHATGLPIPTIFAKTENGVSILRADGTVISNAATHGVRGFAVNENGDVFSGHAVGRVYHNLWPRSAWEAGSSEQIEWSDTSDADGSLIAENLAGVFRSNRYDYLPSTAKAFGRSVIRSIFDGASPRERRMIAAISAGHASGWMVGDTKGAFLASTDATPLATEDFSVQSLTVGDLLISDGLTVTDLGDRLRITRDVPAGSRESVGIDVAVGALTVGALYFAEFELLATGPNNNCYWGASHGGANTFLSASYNVGNFVKRGFSISSGLGNGGVRFGLEVSRGSSPSAAEAGDWVEISKAVTVRRADFDRKSGKKGLIINGTLTREPVADGAELVAYSGFSADNYLSQPYSADLDFGTGDFCVMGWVNTDVVATQIAVSRYNSTSTGRRWEFGVNSGGGARFSIANVMDLNGSLPVIGGSWVNLCLVRRDGYLAWYVNGAFDVGVSNNTDMSALADAELFVGARGGAVAQVPWAGQLALLRISAIAPTANQIRKIYEDERELFKAGAACTLHGSDSMVNALAYDDATDLLHVGTSAGRSVFKGLRRIDQTDTPVTTAIAASGGMIVEA